MNNASILQNIFNKLQNSDEIGKFIKIFLSFYLQRSTSNSQAVLKWYSSNQQANFDFKIDVVYECYFPIVMKSASELKAEKHGE